MLFIVIFKVFYWFCTGHTSTATTKRYHTMKSDSAKEVCSHMFDRFITQDL